MLLLYTEAEVENLTQPIIVHFPYINVSTGGLIQYSDIIVIMWDSSANVHNLILIQADIGVWNIVLA